MTSICPIKKNEGFWLPDEKERFQAAFKKYGKRWSLIAKDVQSRDAVQCRNLYNYQIASYDYGSWTAEEDNALIAGIEKYHTQWAKISKEFVPSRKGPQCRAHAKSLKQRIAKAEELSSKGKHLGEIPEHLRPYKKRGIKTFKQGFKNVASNS